MESGGFILVMHPDSPACREVQLPDDIPRLSVAHPLAGTLFPDIRTIPALVEYRVLGSEALLQRAREQANPSHLSPPAAVTTTTTTLRDEDVVQVDRAALKSKVANPKVLARQMALEREQSLAGERGPSGRAAAAELRLPPDPLDDRVGSGKGGDDETVGTVLTA